MKRGRQHPLPPEAPHELPRMVSGWWLLPAVALSILVWVALILALALVL